MWGGADETEQLPEGPGLVPPSAALVLNGKSKSPARSRRGNHGWRVRHPAPEIGEKKMRRRSARVCLSGARAAGRGWEPEGEQRQEQEHQEHYAYF